MAARCWLVGLMAGRSENEWKQSWQPLITAAADQRRAGLAGQTLGQRETWMFQLTLGRGEVTQCYPRTIHNNIHLHWAFLICLGSLFSHGGCSLRHLAACCWADGCCHSADRTRHTASLGGMMQLWLATYRGPKQLEDQRFNGFEAIQTFLFSRWRKFRYHWATEAVWDTEILNILKITLTKGVF